MKWYDREALQKTRGQVTAGEAVLAGEGLRRQLTGKTMVLRRASSGTLGFHLLTYYIGIFLVTTLIYGLFSMIDLPAFTLALQLLSFYVMERTLYRKMWLEGRKDKNFVLFSNLKYDRFRSLQVALIASLLAWISFALFLLAAKNNSQATYTLFTWTVMPYQLLTRFIVPSGYVADVGVFGRIFMAVIPISVMATIMTGYNLGYRGVRLGQLIRFGNRRV